MAFWNDRWWYRYPPSRPRLAKGGIKAQSRRGTFGESWWAQRWIAVLESFQIGARLGRGRSYARGGQVLRIAVEKGKVTASVQGSRPAPYKVKIQVRVLSAAEWKKLAGMLSRQAIFAAKLLAGEMPKEIEKVFQEVKLSLFPAALNDLKTDCSCPDWSNPCKHTAAVFYLLGEEFDRDPFLIFKMRGMSREELVALLGTEARKGAAQKRAAASLLPSEALPTSVLEFWKGGALPGDLCGEVEIPRVPAAFPKRLGNFPFWRGQAGLLEAIEPVYSQAASRGLNLFLEKV
jgi:uncharacterized Zn finger protein